MKRLYLVGIDAAPLWILKELAKKEKIGAFNKLIEESSIHDMMSTLPPMTGPAWPSIYTGLTPGEHGVPDFFVMKQNYTPDIVFYDSRKNPPFWKELAEHRLKCLVITPATDVNLPDYDNVDCITGFPMQSKANSPELEALMKRYGFYGEPDIEKDMKSGKLSDEDAVKHFVKSIRARAEIAKQMIAKKDYDFVYVCFTETDRMQHFVMGKPRRNEYLTQIYREIGRFIDYLMPMVDSKNSALAIVSDHGAHPIKHKFLLNAWMIRNGYVGLKATIAQGVTQKKGAGVRYALRENILKSNKLRKVYDKMPYDMKKVAFKTFGAAFSDAASGESRLHLFDFDMKQTKAFAAISNNPVATIWINDSRFSSGIVSKMDKKKVKADLVKQLKTVKSVEGDRLFVNFFDGDDYYRNTRKFIAADLLVEAKEGYTLDIFNFSTGSLFAKPEGAKSGDHLRHGIVSFSAGFGKVDLKDFSVLDFAPTVMDYFGMKAQKGRSRLIK